MRDFFRKIKEKLFPPPETPKKKKITQKSLEVGDFVKLELTKQTVDQLKNSNIFSRFTKKELEKECICGMFVQRYYPEKTITGSIVIELLALSDFKTSRIVPILEQEIASIERFSFEEMKSVRDQ